MAIPRHHVDIWWVREPLSRFQHEVPLTGSGVKQIYSIDQQKVGVQFGLSASSRSSGTKREARVLVRLACVPVSSCDAVLPAPRGSSSVLSSSPGLRLRIERAWGGSAASPIEPCRVKACAIQTPVDNSCRSSRMSCTYLVDPPLSHNHAARSQEVAVSRADHSLVEACSAPL